MRMGLTLRLFKGKGSMIAHTGQDWKCPKGQGVVVRNGMQLLWDSAQVSRCKQQQDGEARSKATRQKYGSGVSVALDRREERVRDAVEEASDDVVVRLEQFSYS